MRSFRTRDLLHSGCRERGHLWVDPYPDPDLSYLIQANTGVAEKPVRPGSSNYVIRCSTRGNTGPGAHESHGRSLGSLSTRSVFNDVKRGGPAHS